MKIRQMATLLVSLLSVGTVLAQTPPKMKRATDIPPGIAMPDSVGTRLGTLKE